MLILDKAFNYANAVTQNKIIANSYVKKQCKKFLEDIDKCRDEEYPYFFNYKEIELIEGILSLLNFASGVGVAGLPLLEGLADFQCFILVNFFGFKHKNNPQKRKIETLVLLIARKNAKTFLSSLIILLLLIIDEPYSEFYSVSVDTTLSGIVKKELKQLLEKSQINHHFQQKYNRIIFKSNQNFYVNLHGDADRLDGRKISGAILDECGLYADMGLINAMETGAMASINRSFIFISTAYETDSTVFKSKIEYMERVLDGQIEDASIFGLLYRAENPLEWDTDKALLEANPICYVSKPHLDYLKKQREKVKNIPEQLNAYKTKHLNIFLPKLAAEAYINVEDFKKCKADINYKNKDVYIGLDLSASTDTTAVSVVWREDNNYFATAKAFIPNQSANLKEKIDKVPYRLYQDAGFCKLSGDRVVNFGEIVEYILEIAKECNIKTICYDRQFSNMLIQELENKGFLCIQIAQSFVGLTNATRQFREDVLNKKFFYKENKLLEIHLANTKVVTNGSEQVIPSKKASNGRIDMIASILNCYAYLVEHKEQEFFIVAGRKK
mgnify:CR=1 FL=1